MTFTMVCPSGMAAETLNFLFAWYLSKRVLDAQVLVLLRVATFLERELLEADLITQMFP